MATNDETSDRDTCIAAGRLILGQWHFDNGQETKDWLARSTWTRNEAVHLVCGHAPSAEAKVHAPETIPPMRMVAAMLEIDVPTDWSPVAIVRWAVGHRLRLHPHLIEFAREHGLVEAKSRYFNVCHENRSAPFGSVVTSARRAATIDSTIGALTPTATVVHTSDSASDSGWSGSTVESWLADEQNAIERQDRDEFTPDEVAVILAEVHDLDASELLLRMQADHAKGELQLRAFATKAPSLYRRFSPWSEFMYPADVDAMCERWGVKYRFPPERDFAGRTENPAQRRERLRAELAAEKAAGHRAFARRVAEREGITPSRLRVLTADHTGKGARGLRAERKGVAAWTAPLDGARGKTKR